MRPENGVTELRLYMALPYLVTDSEWSLLNIFIVMVRTFWFKHILISSELLEETGLTYILPMRIVTLPTPTLRT